MKTRFVFYLLSFCCLSFVGTTDVNSKNLASEVEITLSGNEINFERPRGPEKERRSVSFGVPISAFLNDNSIVLDFYQAVGAVEIIISQDGAVVYSSSENIQSPILKSISLPEDLSGSFVLEIKGSNGAYAYGLFNLN